MACSPLLPLPSWSPKKSLMSAIWDWTMKWIGGDSDNIYEEDGGDSDYYDDDHDNYENSGEGHGNENGDTKYDKRGIKTTSSGCNDRNGSWNIQNIDEW